VLDERKNEMIAVLSYRQEFSRLRIAVLSIGENSL
jgi:hypothetical protein